MRLLVTGASGSGTTTLARALAAPLRAPAFDADDYYWLPTRLPFTRKREPAERLSMLLADLGAQHDAIVSGSVMGWGTALEDGFDGVVFLYLDAAIRVERLRRREMDRFGHADPAFLTWAAQYDEGPPEGRSLARHRAWLSARRCPVLELRGDLTVSERVAAVLECADIKALAAR